MAAAYMDGVISLSIDVEHIWAEPLGEDSLGLIIHECAHELSSGHAVAFREEVERLGARLARWVGDNHRRWTELQADLVEKPAVDQVFNESENDPGQAYLSSEALAGQTN